MDDEILETTLTPPLGVTVLNKSCPLLAPFWQWLTPALECSEKFVNALLSTDDGAMFSLELANTGGQWAMNALRDAPEAFRKAAREHITSYLATFNIAFTAGALFMMCHGSGIVENEATGSSVKVLPPALRPAPPHPFTTLGMALRAAGDSKAAEELMATIRDSSTRDDVTRALEKFAAKLRGTDQTETE